MEIKRTAQFDAWLHGLKDRRARLRINNRIRRLANGNPGDHRNLQGGVSELRIREGQGYRVYYTIYQARLVVLLCGGDKSSQSQQQRDIAAAQALAAQIKEVL